MLTKTKIALIAALVAGTASTAIATEFDSNQSNRYPAYNGPVATAQGAFESAPVGLYDGRNVSRGGENFRSQQIWIDRASSPNAVGF